MAKETRREPTEELKRESVRLVVEESAKVSEMARNWRPRVRICDRTSAGGRSAKVCFPFRRPACGHAAGCRCGSFIGDIADRM